MSRNISRTSINIGNRSKSIGHFLVIIDFDRFVCNYLSILSIFIENYQVQMDEDRVNHKVFSCSVEADPCQELQL